MLSRWPSAAQGGGAQEDAVQEPNLTPLIDIVFVLLIFFIVTTSFSRDLGLQVSKPNATQGSAVPAQTVRIAIHPKHGITVDAQITSIQGVETAVRQRLLPGGNDTVLLVADQAVPTGMLSQVMDAARRAGAKDVALAVESTPQAGQTP